MKSIHSRKAGLAAFAVAALLYAAPVSAQTHLMRVNIPFQFAAGNQVLPAGEYEGMLVNLLRTDMPASSAITQELLGWKPTHAGLIEDIEQGHYFT